MSLKPFFGLGLENQFGEKSINQVISGPVYDGQGHSFQVIGPDLNLDPDAGSDDDSDPKFLATIMGNIIGDDMVGEGNYLAGLIGAYSLTGTNGSHLPTGAVLGLIMSEVTVADGAFVAVIDGDGGVTKANAAFKAKMLNSTVGSGFTYGLDLYDPSFGSYRELAILNADIRMSKQVCIFSGATAPVDGTTGDNFAGPGSIYIARDTGKMYLQSSAVTTPVWKIVTSAA